MLRGEDAQQAGYFRPADHEKARLSKATDSTCIV